MAERTHKLEFKFDEASLGGGKVSDRMTVGEWLDVDEGNKRTIVRIISRFAWYDGKLLGEEEASEKILSLDMTTFNALLTEMKSIIEGESETRPTNGADSGAP